MEVARKIDRAIHSLNDELEKVENDNKNHPKVDEQRASKTAAELEPLVRTLREKGDSLSEEPHLIQIAGGVYRGRSLIHKD